MKNGNEWETPQELFARLHNEFHFRIDICASPANYKVKNFWTRTTNALVQSPESWAACGPGWMNPPYSRELLPAFIAKAHEAQDAGGIVVALIPAAVETRYFHTHVIDVADEIRILNRRIRFAGATAGAKTPNVIVVFRPHLGATRWVKFPITREEAGAPVKSTSQTTCSSQILAPTTSPTIPQYSPQDS